MAILNQEESKYKAYPSYKDSGIEWLEEVPENWNCMQLKRTVDGNTNGIWGKEPKKDDTDIIVLRVADFDIESLGVKTHEYTKRSLDEKEVFSRQLKKGDLLLEKSGGGEKTLVGQVVLFDKEFKAVTSNFVAKMTPKEPHNSRFLNYVFARFYFQNINYCSIKQNTGIQNLDASAYLSERFYFPGNSEQTAIANFLDQETGKIDLLIEKQQTMIALLKEKRPAVISHAVTKGLNPNTPLKDSGIEWLGQIPGHWSVKRSKFLFEIRKRIAGELGFSVLSITQKGIKRKDIDSGDGQLSMDYSKYQIVNIGDYAMNHMDLLTGYVDIASEKGVTSPDYRVFSLIEKKSNPEYYLYLFQNGYKQKIFYAFGQGASHLGRWRLPTSEFMNFVFPYPPEEEQAEIAFYLDNQTQKIDTLIEKSQQAIALLKERKTALISAAVTGKIDVRSN